MASKNVSDELMKQNGIAPGSLPDRDREEVDKMLARQRKRVKSAKRSAVIAWILCGLVMYLLPWVVGPIAEGLPTLCFLVGRFMFYGAIVLTIIWYVRSNSLKFQQIHAGLVHIGEQLEHLQKES